MELTQLTVFVLLLIASVCRGEIVIKTSKREKSMARLSDNLINIVTSCYKGQIDGVGLAGNLPSTLIRTLSVQHSIPVALIDTIWTGKDIAPYVDVQFRHKLNVFIIEGSSVKKFGNLVGNNVRYSMWWNHMASFFILDLSPGCADAENYAYIAWQVNILKAKVICTDTEASQTIVFNYNPFTSWAPASWQRLDVLPAIRNDPFTTFIRRYRQNGTKCVDLDFDKMGDLGGYPIHVAWKSKDDLQRPGEINKRGTYSFRIRRTRLLDGIVRTLNATPINVFRPMAGIDIFAAPAGLQYTWVVGRFLATYPYEQTEISIITQFRGYKTQLQKIISIIDVNSRYGVGVVYLITLIFFKFFVNQALVPTFLNLVRMTCNTGFANLRNDNGSRIYLGTLLFFVVTMQGIFSGDLAALLTKHIPLRNVNTIQDLENLGYKAIYGQYPQIKLFEGSDLKKLFINMNVMEDCINRVRDNSSVACIGFSRGHHLDMVQELNLHISTKPAEMMFVSLPIRWFWPLEERVNAILGRMVEADVIDAWDVQCNQIKLSDFSIDKMVQSNVDFKNIELHEVLFTFVILGIGLGCATVVFIIELAIGYKYKCGIKMWCDVVRR